MTAMQWLPNGCRRSLSVALAVAAVVVTLLLCRFFEPLELLSEDLRFSFRGLTRSQNVNDVVVIGITSDSIGQYGEPPWPRSIYAQSIDKLTELGAGLICLDVAFPSPSAPEEDAKLADAVGRAGNVVLPVFCPTALRNYAAGPIRRVDDLRGSLAALEGAALGLGHINTAPGPDGKHRTVPLALEHGGRIYLSLGVEAATRFSQAANRGSEFPPVVLDSLPLTRDGELVINYGGEHLSLDLIPFHEFLSGKIPRQRVAGKVILIGQTALGRVNADVVLTPVGHMYGVFIQATVIQNVLRRSFLVRQSVPSILISVLVLSLLAAALFARLRWYFALLAWVGLTVLLCLAAFLLFDRASYSLAVVPCLLTLAGSYLIALLASFRASAAVSEQRDSELTQILRSSQVHAQDAGIAEAPQTLVGLIGRTVGAEAVTLSLARQPKLWSWHLQLGGRTVLDLEQIQVFEQQTGIAHALTAAPYLRHRAGAGPQGAPHLPVSGPISSVLSLPLAVQSRPVGRLSIYNKRRSDVSPRLRFTEEDMRLITVLAQQTALALDNALLNDDLSAANERLRATLERLKAAQAELVGQEKLSALGKMASMIIHDMRSPLAVLMGLGDLIVSCADSGGDTVRDYGGMVSTEASRLNSMLQEILDFARGSASLVLADVSSDELLAECRQRLAEEFSDRGVTYSFSTHCRAVLRLDKEKMVRALLNLCRNAVEAMQGTGQIRIATARAGEGVSIAVTDTGPGVPVDVQARIFEPFVTAGKKKGIGLGLAIVRKVVTDHGGTIRLQSEAGSGATFVISLPAKNVTG